MTDLIKHITNSILGKIFVNWYIAKYDKTYKLANFINLPISFQLQVIHECIVDNYSIGIHYDANSVLLYSTNVELHANSILASYKSGNDFNSVLHHCYDLPTLSLNKSFQRAINEFIIYMNKPPF